MVAVKTIGRILKEKRTELGLGLSEAETFTKVQKLYIVALETDDYKALPGEFYTKAYLKQYAEKLGLDAEKILAAYEAGDGITVDDVDDIQETYHFVKPSDRVEPDEDDGPRTWRYYIPVILLSGAACVIVAGVALAVLLNHPETPSLNSSAYHYSSSTTSKSSSKLSTSTSSSAPQAPTESLSTTGSGATLDATLDHAKSPVKIVFSIPQGENDNTWLYASNSDLPTTGVTLSSSTLSATANLASGTTSSLITLGNKTDITVTVNGHTLDLTALGATGPYKINLTVKADTPTTTTSSTTAASQ